MRLFSAGAAVSYFLEGGDPRVWPMTLKFELGLDLVTMQLPTKIHHRMFNRSEVIALTNKHTRKERNKEILLKTSTSQLYQSCCKHFVEILLPPDSPIVLIFRHRGSC